MTAVELTADELAECRGYADKRASLHRRAGRADQGFSHGMTNEDMHWQGVASEFAFAKFRGPQFVARWRAESAFREDFKLIAADVGDQYQVRATARPAGGLLVQRKDRDDQTFVLARLHELDRGVVFLVGWMSGADAKSDEFYDPRLRDPGSSYLVPAAALHPMETLP